MVISLHLWRVQSLNSGHRGDWGVNPGSMVSWPPDSPASLHLSVAQFPPCTIGWLIVAIRQRCDRPSKSRCVKRVPGCWLRGTPPGRAHLGRCLGISLPLQVGNTSVSSLALTKCAHVHCPADVPPSVC